MNWKRFVSKKLPILPSAKRYAVALRDSMMKSGGSQCGEDSWLINEISSRKIAWRDIRYIEVGANQPTQLSNTWQLYVRGASGVLVEPDCRCINLLRRFRPRDIVVQAAAGSLGGLVSLSLHQHTTSNSIVDAGSGFFCVVPVPLITVDSVFENVQKHQNWKEVTLLSIDTEGFDDEVLKGAQATLKRTRYVCVENWNESSVTKHLQTFLGNEFEVAYQTPLNVIFRRNERSGEGVEH